VEAFAWMGRVAEEAERLGHHPDWSNVYNRVLVSLWTHDRGGVTELDLALAHFMEDEASSPP
jgi:4a-hydroxytetrahydrobiopterin dehydratase